MGELVLWSDANVVLLKFGILHNLYILSAAGNDPVSMAHAFMLGASAHDEALEWAVEFGSFRCARLAIRYGATAAGIEAAFRSIFEFKSPFRPFVAQEIYDAGISDYCFAWARRRARLVAALCGAAGPRTMPDDGEDTPQMWRDTQVPAMEVGEILGCDLTTQLGRQVAEVAKFRAFESGLKLQWLELQVQPRIWDKIVDALIALSTLALPPYVLLEIFGWAFPGPMSNASRIQLIQGVRDSIKLVLAKRLSAQPPKSAGKQAPAVNSEH